MMELTGKGAFVYALSYIEGSNLNVILPADHPDRLAWAERIADVAEAAGLTYVLIKVADGDRPYNVRWKDVAGKYGPKGKVYFNSLRPEAVDDCVLVVAALQRRGILVFGWQFLYRRNVTGEAAMAIKRIRELKLNGWAVNAEYAHKTIIESEREIVEWKGKKKIKKKITEMIEVVPPPASVIADVRAYMVPVRAETQALGIPLALSTYKFPSSHRSFPFAVFLEYCDLNMPQVYPIGDTSPIAHTQQLSRSLREYRLINPDVPIWPTGGAFSESYVKNGVRIPWVATPEQVTDFFSACLVEGLPAASIWDWFSARDRFPELWAAMAAVQWPRSGPMQPAEPEPAPMGAGDPEPVDWRTLFNDFRIRARH